MSKRHICELCQTKTNGIVHMCDFCGKNERQVTTMVAGNGVDICAECIVIAGQILAEREAERAAKGKPA